MSTTVYAMGKTNSSGGWLETLSVVAKDATGGGTSNYITGYGPEFLTDANQATFLRGYHKAGGKRLQLVPTITYASPLGSGSETSSVVQSVVLVNVSSDYAPDSALLQPKILFYNTASALIAESALTRITRGDGRYDFVWSGPTPPLAEASLIEFLLFPLTSTTYIQIGQMMASRYNQAYTWPCTEHNTINNGDSVIPERNVDQIQAIGGQRFDKFLFQRYIWSGELTTTDQTFMGNLQWWQQQPGIYIQSDEWGHRAPYTTGLYGKLRLGSMADESSTPTVYRVPFEFQENPA